MPLPQSRLTQSNSAFIEDSVSGAARVIVYSPNHHSSIASLPQNEIEAIIQVWIDQDNELSRTHEYVQLFENRGAEMGCSQPHPHAQIWAVNHLPHTIATENEAQANFYRRHNTPFLLHYAAREQAIQERVIYSTDDWLVVVPFWAAWPYETLLIPQYTIARVRDIQATSIHTLARTIRLLFQAYNLISDGEMPYSFGWHQASAAKTPGVQLHAHIFPAFLQRARIGKYMTGYELFCEAQRDILPEDAAQVLRSAISTVSTING